MQESVWFSTCSMNLSNEEVFNKSPVQNVTIEEVSEEHAKKCTSGKIESEDVCELIRSTTDVLQHGFVLCRTECENEQGKERQVQKMCAINHMAIQCNMDSEVNINLNQKSPMRIVGMNVKRSFDQANTDDMKNYDFLEQHAILKDLNLPSLPQWSEIHNCQLSASLYDEHTFTSNTSYATPTNLASSIYPTRYCPELNLVTRNNELKSSCLLIGDTICSSQQDTKRQRLIQSTEIVKRRRNRRNLRPLSSLPTCSNETLTTNENAAIVTVINNDNIATISCISTHLVSTINTVPITPILPSPTTNIVCSPLRQGTNHSFHDQILSLAPAAENCATIAVSSAFSDVSSQLALVDSLASSKASQLCFSTAIDSSENILVVVTDSALCSISTYSKGVLLCSQASICQVESLSDSVLSTTADNQRNERNERNSFIKLSNTYRGKDTCSDVVIKPATREKLKMRLTQSTMAQSFCKKQTVRHSNNDGQPVFEISESGANLELGRNESQTSVTNYVNEASQQQFWCHPIHASNDIPYQHQKPFSASPSLINLENSCISSKSYPGSEKSAIIKHEDNFRDYGTAAQCQSLFNEGQTPINLFYNSISVNARNEIPSNEISPGLFSLSSINDNKYTTAIADMDLPNNAVSETVAVQPQFFHLLQPLDIGTTLFPSSDLHSSINQRLPVQHQDFSTDYFCTNDTFNDYAHATTLNNISNVVDGDNKLVSIKPELMRYLHQQHQSHNAHCMNEQHVFENRCHPFYGCPDIVNTSPDSGIGNEQCVSPNVEPWQALKDEIFVECSSASDLNYLQKLNSQKSERSKKLPNSFKNTQKNTNNGKLHCDTSGYQYFLEAPISTTQRSDEDRVTYLNKSQYYPLTIENTIPDRLPKGIMCKTVIMLVFRDEKRTDDERSAWQFWHSRQHSHKQRILDIDTKNSHGVGPNSISEQAFNAVCVKWNPRESPVKVSIAVHCLSTDFSSQKGVKGIPLHIQCDTYEMFVTEKRLLPTHRGYCQIKVFCDKGAERKTRDEERRRNIKISKTTESTAKSSSHSSTFYSMSDLSTPPVYFCPSYLNEDPRHESNMQMEQLDEVCGLLNSHDSSEVMAEPIGSKFDRVNSCTSCSKQISPLLYIKEGNDEAYHAIYLQLPTVEELLKAMSHKFNKQLQNVTNLFKRSKKGILVRMDDELIRNYSHESAFLLEINHHHASEVPDVVLVEICQ